MSTIEGVEEIDGRLRATARNVAPPVGWTNDFEVLGGEDEWGEGGMIRALLSSAGIDESSAKPLYASEPWTGATMYLFEADDPANFYLFDRIDQSLHKITNIDFLETVVEWMNDEDKGFQSMELEQIF